MIVKEEVEKVLNKYLDLPLTAELIGQITAEIVALQREWEELEIPPEEMGYSASVNCVDICAIDKLIEQGEIIKFFRKRGEKREPGQITRQYRRIALHTED